jgi:hypothetical protein
MFTNFNFFFVFLNNTAKNKRPQFKFLKDQQLLIQKLNTNPDVEGPIWVDKETFLNEKILLFQIRVNT